MTDAIQARPLVDLPLFDELDSVEQYARSSTDRPSASDRSRRAASAGVLPRQRHPAVVLTDIAIVLAASLLGVLGRFGFDDTARLAAPSAVLALAYPAVAGLTAVAWSGWLWAHGCWNVGVLGNGAVEFRRILRAGASLFAVVVTADYLLRLEIARGFLLLALPLGTIGMLAARLSWRRRSRLRRRAGHDLVDVLVIGGRFSAAVLARQLQANPEFGCRVTGLCVPDGDADGLRDGGATAGRPATLDGVPVVGGLDTVPEVVQRTGVAVVAVSATDGFGPREVRRLSWALEGTGVKLVVAPSVSEITGPRIRLRAVGGIALLEVDLPRFRGLKLITKTVLDVVLAGMAALALTPLMLVVALAIKAQDGGPVLFRQERTGQHGRTFQMWKFRSMTVDAEARLDALRASSDGNDLLFKLRSDPRVTRVGGILRRFSIDELPQLFNVLAGQMSLVGPRPPLPAEVARYERETHRRLLVKPGITGLWQVSGRSDLSWEESVRLDLFYVENWSPTGDLAILAQTATAIFSRRGAY